LCSLAFNITTYYQKLLSLQLFHPTVLHVVVVVAVLILVASRLLIPDVAIVVVIMFVVLAVAAAEIILSCMLCQLPRAEASRLVTRY
jgi:glucan phosphoethanolaminetransferase (alkaline phosphatase superfamily)